MRNVRVAAIRCNVPGCGNKYPNSPERLARQTADQGAHSLAGVVWAVPLFLSERQWLLPVLQSVIENTAIQHFRERWELNIVLPISFYEKDGNVSYNSIAVIDADGSAERLSGRPYTRWSIKKSFYFTPGNTGFKVWDTRYIRLGLICWDQWFPETARLALNGAELLFIPSEAA